MSVGGTVTTTKTVNYRLLLQTARGFLGSSGYGSITNNTISNFLVVMK